MDCGGLEVCGWIAHRDSVHPAERHTSGWITKITGSHSKAGMLNTKLSIPALHVMTLQLDALCRQVIRGEITRSKNHRQANPMLLI